MSIKRTIITTIVALALVAAVVPVVASADTLSDLMAQIANLTAQLNALRGSTPAAPTTGACAGVTFNRNLTIGSTGSDVKCLQTILNQSATTQIATTGAGSPGNETSYFGGLTLAAVKKYQAANGLTPANQVGPLTRAKLTAALGTYVPPVNTTLPAGCTSTSGFSPTTGASCATGVVVIPTGPVSAMLSSDTPATGALIGSEASADLLHVNFTGSGTVTSVTLQRYGISTQNTLTNVYLYDGNTRLTDGYSFNVNGQLVMNGLSIAVGGSHIISVKADTAAYDATASSIAVALVGFTANGSAVSANVMGSMMMVVPGSAATAYLGANSVVTTSASPTTLNAGTSQYTVWSAPMQINTRAVMLKMASFKMVGSAPSNALANIKLFVDGVDTGKVATVITISGSSYASFDLTSAPITLTTGSHTVDVRADIVSGASRTIQLSIQQAADLTITDPQVGVNIAALGASGAAFTANLGAYISINTGSGSVVVDPTFTSATNVPAGATNAVIGRFVIHGFGEDVKVNSIQVTPTLSALASSATTVNLTTSVTQTVTVASNAGFVAGNTVKLTTQSTLTGTVNSLTGTTQMSITFSSAPTAAADTISVSDKGLNNVTLYFNGSQIGSQQSPAASASALTFTLGSQMIVPAGQDSTLEIRADLQQETTTTAYGAGTVVVALTSATANAVNAQGQSSQNTIAVPTASVTTTGLSISSASLAVSKNTGYGTQTVSPNTANVKIGSFIAQNQSTSESVRLTTLTVALTSNGSAVLNTSTGTSLYGLTSLRTSDTTGSGSTPIQPTASNTFSVNDTLAPGASMVIDILANTGDSTTLTAVVTKLTVASIGVSSNISSAGTAATGQTISLSAGSIGASGLTLVTSPTSTTPASFIAGGTGSTSQATFNFVATSAPATISELKFTVSDGSTGSITNICIAGTTQCAQPVSNVADLTGLSLAVPTGGGLSQALQVSYQGVGLTGLTPGTQSHITLDYVRYTSGGTTSWLCSTAGASAGTCTLGAGTSFTAIAAPSSTGYIHLVSSIPTVTVATTTGATFTPTDGAVQDAGRITIAAGSGGSVKIRQLAFTVGFGGYSNSPTLTQNATTSYLTVGSSIVAYCDASTLTLTCKFTDTGAYTGSQAYADDFTIPANQSTTFDVYTKLGTAPVGTGTLSENVSLLRATSATSTASMLWDDTSTAGATGSVALNDYYIYGFPTNGSSIHN